MAVFVMSDIHGKYQQYQQAIEKIGLGEDDTLYVLGDVVDRGEGSCRILLDMSCNYNIVPLLGNHEFMAMSVLSRLNEEITSDTIGGFDQEFITGMLSWLANGGDCTLNEFKKLSPEDRRAVLEYLGEFGLYEEITINDRDYVLVHAGLDNFSRDRRLEDYRLDELIWAKTDYGKVYYEDKTLITGHTPVQLISGGKTDRIIKTNNHIAIDCGCSYGGRLAVLCLDTMEEMYF